MDNKKNIELCENVCAVVVTFQPNKKALQELLSSLRSQVNKIIVIDNASSENVRRWCDECDLKDVKFYELSQNFGIAHAQNYGIKISISENYKYTLLLDQDSLPTQGMVVELSKGFEEISNEGEKVAAVGPYFHDEKYLSSSQFVKIKGLKYHVQERKEGINFVKVNHLIASGSLLSNSALNDVGLMKDDLFIDYVDIEWGLRASSFGYDSYGVFSAIMQHNLGDSHVSVLGRSIPLHSSLRHYYMVRNAFWLYKQSYIPLRWKIVDGKILMKRALLYCIYSKPFSEHFYMMLKGGYDGLRSKLGKH